MLPQRLLIIIAVSFSLFTLRYFARHHTSSSPRLTGQSAAPPSTGSAAAEAEGALMEAVGKLSTAGGQEPALVERLRAAELWGPLSQATGTALLRAAPNFYRPGVAQEATEAFARLLMAHAQQLPPDGLADLLPQAEPRLRLKLLQILATPDSLRSSKMLARLVESSLTTQELRYVMMQLVAHPHHPAILLPPLLRLPADDMTDHLLLAYAHAGLLPKNIAQQVRSGLLLRYEAAQAAQNGEDAMGVLLHLFAYLPVDWFAPQVSHALQHPSDQVVLYALLARLVQGGEVPPALVARVAANNATRISLLNELQERGRLDLCPPQFKTDEARAEGELVEWLTYPTELGAPPEAIELVQAVQLAERPSTTYYVFRFRGGVRGSEWMMGLSSVERAPADAPQVASTFSNFDPMGSKTPEEHVRAALGLVDGLMKAGAADDPDPAKPFIDKSGTYGG